MLKKLIASGSAAVIALTSLANGLVLGAPAVTDPELIDAVSWAYDAGLTKFADADAFMPFNNLTREQFAKFASEFAVSVLEIEADDSMTCSFSDEASFDSSLAASIKMACQQGLMMGSNGQFMPKQLVTRGQVAIVVSRMLGEIDPQASQQEHFAYLQSQGIMNVANLDSAITRGDALLILYRIANGDDTDLCTIDPSLPGCDDTTDPTDPIVKEGDLNVSLNPSSPANMSSIPNNGVSRFATVDFTAGSKDVTVSSVSLKRAGLGTYTDFGSGGRLYFEINGVRVSSRATVSSDDTTVLSFSPALVVAAGKTVSVDLMAELVSAPTGTENEFLSTMIDSSAANVNGSIDTPTLRTAAYSVRSVTFTNQNVLTTYQGNEETVELGKFQLQNVGANTINVNVQAITLRNVGNGDVTQGLSDLKLLRAGNAVSSSVIVNGRDVTFVLADSITDGQTASYTVQAKVADVENASGDTYKFILRQSTDLNAKEANTGFRTAVTITANVANNTTTANQYTVNGGELRFVRDTSLSLSQNVSPGALAIELMKGTIEAKQAILLEDVLLNVTAGSLTIHDAFKKVYLQVGNAVFTWTPDAVTPANNAVAEFDGSVTVNGTVNVRIYADVYTNATSPAGPYTFGSLDGSSFTRKEYVSNQNNVSSSIGNIAGSAVSLINSTLSVTKFDNLGTVVYATNNAQNKVFYGIRLSNNQNNPIKVGSITLTPSNIAFNNGVSVTLKQGSTSLATKTLNGATTFNGLNIVVNKDTPVDLTFEGNFLSTITPPQVGTFGVSFNAGDVIDNVTSNNVTVTGTPATSAQVSVISGGTTVINSTSSVPPQSFVTAGETKKIGSINIQAVNDELEVRGLYLRITGTGAFAANAGNQVSNLQIKDSLGNVVASETSRATQTNANDIVKFTSVVSNTKIAAGASKSFDVFATINPVNNSASAGEFSISLATTYNDGSYTDEYQGTRLFSINAGTYVTAGTIGGVSNPTAFQATTVTLSSNYYVVASYPKLVAVDLVGDDFKLIEFKITNPSTTNTLRADSFAYVANATTTGDLFGKIADVYVNNNPQATQLTIASGGSYTFAAPLEVAPGSDVTIKVQLTTPYIASPANGTRTRNFTIDNLGFTQVFSDASTQTIASIALGYQASAGLKLQANKTY